MTLTQIIREVKSSKNEKKAAMITFRSKRSASEFLKNLGYGIPENSVISLHIRCDNCGSSARESVSWTSTDDVKRYIRYYKEKMKEVLILRERQTRVEL